MTRDNIARILQYQGEVVQQLRYLNSMFQEMRERREHELYSSTTLCDSWVEQGTEQN